MRPKSGRKVRAMNSNGGAIGLCVPPSNVSVEGVVVPSKSGNNTVWKTRVVLPAPPIAKW